MYRGSVTNLSKLTKEEVRQFINSFDTVLTDCDGVLWRQDTVIDKANEVINQLRQLGKRIFYITNNSTKIREEYAKKCKTLNFIASKEEIVGTAYLTASYLKSKDFNKTVYIIGTAGIAKELDLVGIKHTDVGPDVLQSSVSIFMDNLKLEDNIGAVVVGFDEHLSYPKIFKALNYLKDPNCLFIATNTDEQFPLRPNLLGPGSGVMVAAVQAGSGRKPIILGKPHTYLSDMLMKEFDLDPKRTIMIGDRANTDIALGNRCGFQTMLVLSGVTQLDDVFKWKESKNSEHKELIPDVYLEKLGDLLSYLD